MSHSAVASDSEYRHASLTPPERRESRYAAQRRLAFVARAEPAISSAVKSIVGANGCQLARFETRMKTLNSLDRKVQTRMCRTGADAEVIVQGINDLLRYTVVVPDSRYWSRGTRIINALIRAGYRPKLLSPGWTRNGYRGRNCTFISPAGLEFEVQFHTNASLAAAEETHADYEVTRDDATTDKRRAELLQRMNQRYALVPVPDDVLWVD
jgi:hypothetical protein